MTTRLAMAVVLLLVLLAQAWGLVSVWRDDPLHGLVVGKKKEAPARDAMAGKSLSLQPMVYGVPPDFNEGYIFNVERSLAAGEGKDGQSRSAGMELMDKVQYNGSIIAENNTRALLSYPLATPGSLQKQGFLRVVVGDTVNGYMVADILPEKIIFSRGGQEIIKLLHDANKEQTAEQPPPSVSEPMVPTSAAPRVHQSPTQKIKPRIFNPPKAPSIPSDEEESRDGFRNEK
ncbi:MAG: hypothetical protein KKE82_02705 [Proteobacteria bacterium]|nr:hypothetical protein [Pseudomonadota bacterium]MBU1545656.1 hypothetical protein [Pseudomonadota bacterium]MBU2459477.1 hypothetical protein [Nanoarchaeota archaeon]